MEIIIGKWCIVTRYNTGENIPGGCFFFVLQICIENFFSEMSVAFRA